MDAVQVEPVVPTIGLTAGRDADITARIKASASYTPSIWVAYSGYKEYPTTPHTLPVFKCPYMVVPLFCGSLSMVMGSCPSVSMVEPHLTAGDLNAVGGGVSSIGPPGISFTACLASNSFTVGGLVIWASATGTSIQVCLGRLRTGVITTICRVLAHGIDYLSPAKNPPMSGP